MRYDKIAYFSGVDTANARLGLKTATVPGADPSGVTSGDASTNIANSTAPAPQGMMSGLDAGAAAQLGTAPKLANTRQIALPALAGLGGGSVVGGLAAPEGQGLEGALIGGALGAAGAGLGSAGGKALNQLKATTADKNLVKYTKRLQHLKDNPAIAKPGGMLNRDNLNEVAEKAELEQLLPFMNDAPDFIRGQADMQQGIGAGAGALAGLSAGKELSSNLSEE